MNHSDRYRGCLLGLACGDAVGTTVEFMPRNTFPPVTDMVGGGPFGLAPGEWTDDTSMALCLATSLVHRSGFDAVDQMNRYCNWRSVGYLSSNGRCFDIGITVATALDRYLRTANPFAGDPDPKTAGNGALMRLAPIPMYYRRDASRVVQFAAESTRTTHGAQEAIDSSKLFALYVRAALLGADKQAIWSMDAPAHLSPKLQAIAHGRFLAAPRDLIKGSGYCVDALQAALWCFNSTDSFESAILAAANLGDDADTTAAICGQLAGAYYGASSIPAHWLERLAMRSEIEALADQLLDASESDTPQDA